MLHVASVEHHLRRVGEVVHLRRDAWEDSVGERPVFRGKSFQNPLSPMTASENNWTIRVSGSGGWTYP